VGLAKEGVEMTTVKEEVKAGKVDTGKRKNRVPLGSLRPKMSLSARAEEYFAGRGEVVRWVNDHPGRLEAAVESGRRFVGAKEITLGDVGLGQDASQSEGIDSRVRRVVGQGRDGKTLYAYLMAMDKEDYDEDQACKIAQVEKKESAMKRGIDQYGQPGDSEGRYIPKTGIKIEVNK